MYQVMVIGAGRVGSVIARDLADDDSIQVTLVDRDSARLEHLSKIMKIKPLARDLSDPEQLAQTVADHDLVVGALPGNLGRQAMEGAVDAGMTCVDISFMAEDPRELNEKAQKTGAVMVYDFGVAPGMSNLIAKMEADRFSPTESVRIYVGGLPTVRRHPWEYSAPFSPSDVVEEYIRPARIRRAGKMVIMPPLSELEHIDVPGIGTLEAFLSDGLRSLVDTVDCPDIAELTLRYPGHRDRIKLLADAGFLSPDPVSINGSEVAPLDMALAVLERGWRPDDDSEEFTVMQIAVTGQTDEGPKKSVWNLYDRTDTARNESSMARTTGFPVAILARKLLNESVCLDPGIHPPEALAANSAFTRDLFDELSKRGVKYTRQSTDDK